MQGTTPWLQGRFLRFVFMVAGLCFASLTVVHGAGAAFIRADSDASGRIDLTDALYTLQYLFLEGGSPTCLDASDANDDGVVDLSDAIQTLGHLFLGAPPPSPPFPDCGPDPTPDVLGCAEYAPCVGAYAGVVINEFLAINDTGLRDGNGEQTDWIEIANHGSEAVDLAGWYLTDDPADRTHWMFHDGAETRLARGDFLVVFASASEADDAVDPEGHFHTSFALDGNGEYLALVHPDGQTVVSSFTPRFPRQRRDVSYGVVADSTGRRAYVAEKSPARWFVSSEELPGEWNAVDHDDGGWEAGTLGLGYDIEEQGLFQGKFETDMEPHLFGQEASVYVRVAFEIEAPSSALSLTLYLRHKDAVVAYLNGVEVVQAEGPRPDPEAVTGFVEHDLTAHLPALLPGRNVLALHAERLAPESPRFLLLPVLEADVRGDVVQYFTTPSPGAPNSAGAHEITGDTEFSVDRGLHSAPFDVAITTRTPGSVIRYTLDGRPPTRSSGLLYTGPLRIESTTILRAAAFREGYLPTDVDTQTYLFLAGPGGVLRQPDLPLAYPGTWAGYPADYGMDPEVVDDPLYAPAIEDDMRALPSLSIVTAPEHLFGTTGIYDNPRSRGDSWERPASVELFSADGSEELQTPCGIRIQGGAGARPEHPKHSFRLIFRQTYGDGKLDQDLFGSQPHGRDSVESFDKLSLRGGFNNTFPHWYDEQALRAQYVRDQWARDLQFEMGHRSTLGRYVHLYLNGMYWGLYNLGERPDDDFAASYYGGDDEDYDVIKNKSATSGNTQAWLQLHSLVSQDVTASGVYSEILQLVDPVNLIDYVIENFYFGNTDWDNHNWVAIRRREDGWRFLFYAWDSEFGISLAPGSQPDEWAPILGIDRTALNNEQSPTRIFQRLRLNPEFRLLVADRIHRHFFHDGILTPMGVTAIWMRRADQVDRAIVGESARWGDFRRDVSASRDPPGVFPLLTRDEHYLAHQRFILEEYFPQRTEVVLDQFRRRGFYPDLEPPGLAPHGGDVEPGVEVLLSAASGVIYYTLDGSDPRLAGGELSPTALLGGDGTRVSIQRTTRLKARRRLDGEWSPLNEALFTVDAGLRLTELMYHPPLSTPAEVVAGHDDPDDFEFLELLNTSEDSVSLEGVRFTDGVEFIFADRTLGRGQRLVLVRDLEAFEARYGPGTSGEDIVAGVYQGRLSNAGERITLVSGSGDVLLDFEYDDAWYPETDGEGHSLVVENEDADPDTLRERGSWRASARELGTPGTAEP